MPEEIVELRGHLIDSLILPKVLDAILRHNACYEIRQFKVGIRPQDPSFARILIAHKDPRRLEAVLRECARYGAEPVERKEVRLAPATQDGVFPDDFYATTHLDTFIYLGGRWAPVKNAEMDCGIGVSKMFLRIGRPAWPALRPAGSAGGPSLRGGGRRALRREQALRRILLPDRHPDARVHRRDARCARLLARADQSLLLPH